MDVVYNDSNMECTFCKKSFSTKGSLEKHQQTAKFCLKIQGRTLESSFKCENCNKIFTQKTSLYDHFPTCKERHKKILEEKEDEHSSIVKRLENEIAKIKRLEKDKLKEKDEILKDKIKEKDLEHQQKIKEKNEYISKIESKLERLENAVTAIAMESIRKNDSNSEDEDKAESKPVTIPLSQKINSILEDLERKDDEVEYDCYEYEKQSHITLNNVVISSRPVDHYVNATQLCQAGGKLFKDWFRLDTTKELINELSADGRILPSALVETKRGGNEKNNQGSWIHPDLSIQLAQWISPKFAIQVSKWIRTLFGKGSVEIDLAILHEKQKEIRAKDHRIKQLETVCLTKQRRIEYPEKNVIYMLTTEDHIKRRTYIIGKAKNLTNRLSTYNKTCDHIVVHFQECKNEEDMDTAETMVLNKLRDYREQANRDRFILPDDKDESFFTSTIDDCISFL